MHHFNDNANSTAFIRASSIILMSACLMSAGLTRLERRVEAEELSAPQAVAPNVRMREETIAAPEAVAAAEASLVLARIAAGEIANADPKTVETFQVDCLDKARAAAKSYRITVPGKNGWLFFAPELRHVGVGKFWGDAAKKVSQSSLPENADPLPAILDFKAQLDKAGIELILVPVPPKSLIYPDMASGKVVFAQSGPTRLDPHHQEFYDVLRRNGVAVLDLVSEFTAHRLDASGSVYCKQDTHWSGRGCVLAARRIAAFIQDRPWLKSVPKLNLENEWRRIKIEGDLWQGLVDYAPAKETLPLRFVGTRPANTSATAASRSTLKPVEPDRNSSVILLGDSHDLVFHEGDDMHARGAGLPDQLALELGFAVDLIAVRGSGATPARTNLMRRVRADPAYLSKKKLVIWCFSAREFTETVGWEKLPVVP